MAKSLAYPSGEEGDNFIVQMISTYLRYAKRKGGGSAPCAPTPKETPSSPPLLTYTMSRSCDKDDLSADTPEWAWPEGAVGQPDILPYRLEEQVKSSVPDP